MAFGVFIHRHDSIYDDSLAERYQFPAQYLGRVQACLNDWVIYYEPVKVPDSRGYFAVAKVREIIRDEKSLGMYLALIEPGSYLDFGNNVPFSGPEGVIERGLLNEHERISGRAQSAVRPLSPTDFYRICEIGLNENTTILPRIDAMEGAREFSDVQQPLDYYEDRTRVSFWNSRIVRDYVFRRVVLNAYDERCAVTGLKLINGGGRAEVEAAHIQPVEKSGPDIVSNGIALSGTIHWMFDRGLIGIANDHQILLSRQINDVPTVSGMINKSGRILVPVRPAYQPNPRFLAWHRENCFKA